jgi:uroporphyrin-3 C-methyltransferase
MSETDKPEETPAETVDEPAAEEVAEEVTEEVAEEVIEEAAEPEVTKNKRGAGVAWLALLVAVIAAAGSGYTVYSSWQDRGAEANAGQSEAALRSRIADTQQAIDGLEQQLEQLGDRDADLSAQIAAVGDDVDQRVRLLDSLPSRMSSLEQSLASLQGLSAGARDTLLVAEAEYYMQIANAQLQLAGNPELAAMALTMADDRIVQIANPALTDVRRTLSDELAALEVMENPDVEGATLTLASLSRVVESLPLRQETDEADEEAAEADAEVSAVDRAWGSVKGVFSNLVTVTRTDDQARPLLAPDAVYFLRTNLSLQLQAARLALLRGEKSIYEQSLHDASAWIEEYFDTDSQQVQSTLQTLAEIRDGTFAVDAPDISQSLRLLRQFRTLNESAQ